MRDALRIITVAILAAVAAGCGARNIVITPLEIGSPSATQFPLSVRVELSRVEQRNPHPVTPVFVDEDSLRQTLITFINRRKTFREVVESDPDATLTVTAMYELVFERNGGYVVSLEGELIARGNLDLGRYFGKATVAWQGLTRFTAEADRVPLNQAMNKAMDDLFKKIEESRQGILATIAKPLQPEVATRVPAPLVSPALPIPTSDVDRVPTASVKPKKNAYAVVIGIEQYREKLPKADFADRDAKLMGEYLTKVLGYSEENVVVRTNEKASLTDLIKYLENWLPNNLEKDGSVFVYYSGHGAPNTKTGDAYLVPYDGDPTFVESTGYPVKRLYAALEKLLAKDITVVLDSCFSGAGGRSVIAKGMRPMVISVENPILATGKTVVLAASSGVQVSSTYEEKGHGLLTYYFLKGLQGEGDLNKDGAIEMAELYEYVKPNVQRVARKQYNNEQTPQLLASPDLLRKGGGRLVELGHP